MPAEALTDKPIGSIIQDARLDVTTEQLAKVRQMIATVFETGTSCEYHLANACGAQVLQCSSVS
jgi:hypothetical protein